jgi:serine protease Do
VITFLFALAIAAPAKPTTSLASLSDAFEQITQDVSPSVVEILASGYRPADAYGATSTSLITMTKSLGSGVALSADGFIVTNAHVVEGATRFEVRLPRKFGGGSILAQPRAVEKARLVGVDDETDLAVLKVERTDLTPMRLGDSDELRPGQIVLAIGSPRGLDGSVSMGVVSAKARQLTPEAPLVYVQTDAPINPGNSGGALVNAKGELVGINTRIISASGGSEGLGFAVPSNIMKHVVDHVRRLGRVRRCVIGVRAQTITPALALGLGLDRKEGVVLGDVVPQSPADRAGLHTYDIVLSLDGKPMENGRQLDVNLYRKNPGDKVKLLVLRGKEQLTVEVEVMERPDDPARFRHLVDPTKNAIARLGIVGLDLTEALAARFSGLRYPKGVIVALAAYDGFRETIGLQAGDVIHAVNGDTVASLGELRAAIDPLQPGAAVALHIERDGRLGFVAFEIAE